MPELHDVLERRARGYAPRDDLFERVLDRRDVRRRNRRLAAGVLGVAVFVIGTIGFVRLVSNNNGTPATRPSPSPSFQTLFQGAWVSTSEPDGGSRTMKVRTSADADVAIEVRDDEAAMCSGGPSTMIGAGRVEGGSSLVIPAPHYACDDGTEPVLFGGPPVDETLVDYTFALDAGSEILTDSYTGGVWVRPGAASPGREELPATSYEIFDGDVTFGASGWEQGFAGAWALWFGADLHERVHVLADPHPVTDRCERAPGRTDAEALAESIRADVDLKATEPVTVTIGGAPALQIDVTAAPGASICGTFPFEDGAGVVREAEPDGEAGAVAVTLADDEHMRLYLLDVPDGSGRIVAIAVVGPEGRFEGVLTDAAPLLDSVEIHGS
jgi:hypothetical protein